MLLEKFVELYGVNNVKPVMDLGSLQEKELKVSELVVIDLKACEIPKDEKFIGPVLALTTIPTFPEALYLLQIGIRGYGNRHMRRDNLDQAVGSVKAGQIWLPPAILTQLIDTVGNGTTAQQDEKILDSLSKREQEVAGYVAEGMSNKEMADKMYISLRTVKAHLSSVYEKTGLRNRLELGLRLKNSSHAY